MRLDASFRVDLWRQKNGGVEAGGRSREEWQSGRMRLSRKQIH